MTALEELEAMGIGAYTRHALEALRDRSGGDDRCRPSAVLLPPKEIPPPTSEEQAAILEEVRDYALTSAAICRLYLYAGDQAFRRVRRARNMAAR